MKIALVVNPTSGRKFNREAITTLRNRLLDNHQVEHFSASSDEELDEEELQKLIEERKKNRVH